MTRRSIGLMLPPVLLLALAAASGTPSANASLANAGTAALTSRASADNASAVQAKGRYKKQGDNCEWDANDGGPNQCEPAIKGALQEEGDKDACAWDANDVGADQKLPSPPKGRWKKGGDGSSRGTPTTAAPTMPTAKAE